MKKDIQPKLNKDCKVTCACGNTFVTTSILPEIRIEICSACHPFYTGQQKLVDTEGRIDKFKKRMLASQELIQKATPKTKTKSANADNKSSAQPTLKDLLEQSRKEA